MVVFYRLSFKLVVQISQTSIVLTTKLREKYSNVKSEKQKNHLSVV